MSILLKSLRGLLAYTIWADRKVLEAMASLPAADLESENGSAFHSVLGSMKHILEAEKIWLGRFLGSPLEPPSAPSEVPDLPTLAAGFTDLWPQLEFFLASLSETQLDADIYWTSSDGASHTAPVHRALLHLVNHSTYHRGQVAMQLRQLGATPPSTDLIYWRGEF